MNDRTKRLAELTDKGISRGEAEDLVGRLEGLKKEAAMVEKLDQLYAQVGNTIADGIVAGITDAIEGGENLQKILSDTLKSSWQAVDQRWCSQHRWWHWHPWLR